MSQWVERPSPKSRNMGTGWFREIDQVYTDGEYAVMSRKVETEWGTVVHVCIRNAENTDIPWSEKQRMKEELFGIEKTAIEVYPAQSDLVDEANMYHIWILPEGMNLPFTLKEAR